MAKGGGGGGEEREHQDDLTAKITRPQLTSPEGRPKRARSEGGDWGSGRGPKTSSLFRSTDSGADFVVGHNVDGLLLGLRHWARQPSKHSSKAVHNLNPGHLYHRPVCERLAVE